MSGKILVQNLKPLIVGRGSIFGSALTQTLINGKSGPLTVDRKQPKALYDGESFTKMNVADSSIFDTYLSKMPNIDAVVNLAGVRKSYNYYLSYLISKSMLEKLCSNPINEYGCRGVIINLIHLSRNYDTKYFAAQDEFAKEYEIDDSTIDDQVYELADQLTANRIRCNTIMVDEKVNPRQFADLVRHVIEDQYVAGQVINMEDKLVHKPPTADQVMAEIENMPKRQKGSKDEPYQPPQHSPKLA